MTSELDPEARELIGLAMQGERRLPRDRERVRRGVLAAVVAPAALGLSDAALAAGKVATVAGSGAGAKAAVLGAATWLKVAPVVLVSAAAGFAGMQQLRPAAPATKPAVVSAPVAASVAPAALPVVAPAPAPAEPDAAAPSAPSKTTRVNDPPSTPCSPSRLSPVPCPPSPAPGPAAPPSLASELEALQRAQRALNAGNAASALSELRAVTGSALRAERTALEVFAHCALGNVTQARQQAALFRRLAPGSPLLPRVNASCARE